MSQHKRNNNYLRYEHIKQNRLAYAGITIDSTQCFVSRKYPIRTNMFLIECQNTASPRFGCIDRNSGRKFCISIINSKSTVLQCNIVGMTMINCWPNFYMNN